MEFLTGKKMQNQIKNCLSSKDDKRCAVAFVGRGASNYIKGKCEIVCDLFSSGTNPREVKKLLSMKNVSVRHKKGLHSKIYLTKEYAILGSANMTNHALNFDGLGNNLIESAFKFVREKMPKSYNEIKEFVDGLWDDSEKITKDMVDRAIDVADKRGYEKDPIYLNLNDMCDDSFYIRLYTSLISEEAREKADEELGENWKRNGYDVYEGWENLPQGPYMDFYWHPKSQKIEFCGLWEYNGTDVNFKYENGEDGILSISKKIECRDISRKSLNDFVNSKIIPAIKKKYTYNQVNDEDFVGVIPLYDLID